MKESLAVETKGLTKRFGEITALDGLDLSVKGGETYGLLGPNGSGKTTLIRLLLGILKPTAGEIWVLGKKLPNREASPYIGYMTQAEALYLDLTVRENVLFFAALYSHPSGGRIEEVIKLVGLSERAGSLISTLSGGMKRRVSLACALVHKPRLLLLDEPTVGIDPRLRATFWSYFRELNKEGTTIILSTHVMDEAERCNRLGLLREGRLLAEGDVEELKARTGKATLEEAFLYYSGGSLEQK
ncbi:MAG: ABC transporter ATP-binding protein [Chloroflexi bacterium]|nr:ABC transporter ATP-binding protein [Chloroflexota bacterium]